MKLIFFNPFSPLYCLPINTNRLKDFEVYLYHGIFELSQKIVAQKICESFGLKLMDKVQVGDFTLILNPWEIDSFIYTDLKTLTVDLTPLSSRLYVSVNKFKDLLGTVQPTSEMDIRRTGIFGSPNFEPTKFIEEYFERLFTKSVATKLFKFSWEFLNGDLEDTCWLSELKSVNSKQFVVLLDNRVKLNFDLEIGLTNELKELISLQLSLNHSLDVTLVCLKPVNEANLRWTKNDLVRFGFIKYFEIENLIQLFSLLDLINTKWIYFLDTSSQIKVRRIGEFQDYNSNVVLLLSSIAHKSNLRKPFLGCEIMEFKQLLFKTNGDLLRDVALFSPSFFMFRTHYLRLLARDLRKFIAQDKISSVNNFLRLACLLDLDAEVCEQIVVIKERGIKEKFFEFNSREYIDFFEFATLNRFTNTDILSSAEKLLRDYYPSQHLRDARVVHEANVLCEQIDSNIVHKAILPSPHISVITCLYGSFDYTEKYLESLAKIKTKLNFEVILVDNNSPDKTREELIPLLKRLNLLSKVSVIFLDSNKNFSGGNNIGSCYARSDYLLFLNNDMVVTDYCFDYLFENFRDPSVGIVGAKLLYPENDSIQHAGVAFYQRSLAFHIFRCFPKDHPLVNHKRSVKVVTGACIMIPKNLFISVGGFDLNFVNELEDVDLCLKIKEKGLKVVYEPRSVIYHYESKSLGRINILKHLRSLEVFLQFWPSVEEDMDAFYKNHNIIMEV